MLNLPEDHYTLVEDHRVRYREAGSGPPLLLLHGLGDSVLTWRQNIEPLALDLPGHGLSDLPRLRYHSPEAARAPRAILRIFDRCGYWPHVEHTEEFHRVLGAFLSTTRRRGSAALSVRGSPIDRGASE